MRVITIKIRIEMKNPEKMLDKAGVVGALDSTDSESKIKKLEVFNNFMI